METQIAKENVVMFRRFPKIEGYEYISITHKQTCQRWLDWMSEYEVPEATHDERVEKIEDLKQAIKIYEEAGI